MPFSRSVPACAACALLGMAGVLGAAACADREATPDREARADSAPTPTVAADGAAGEVGAPPDADTLITARGVGPVVLSMSEEDLLERVGAEAVERIDAYLGEGFCAPGSRVFPGTARELEITWSDTTYSAISRVSVARTDSPWHTPRGVCVGSSLDELESLSGEVVRFGGFGWDYGGGTRWSEGELALGLRLGATPGSEQAVADDPRYPEILGEGTVRSDHPVVRRMTVLVERIDLAGPEPRNIEYECPG